MLLEMVIFQHLRNAVFDIQKVSVFAYFLRFRLNTFGKTLYMGARISYYSVIIAESLKFVNYPTGNFWSFWSCGISHSEQELIEFTNLFPCPEKDYI